MPVSFSRSADKALLIIKGQSPLFRDPNDSLMRDCNLMASNLDEFSQSFVDSSVVAKHLGDIGINLNEICASAIVLDIFSSYAALHLGEVILCTKLVCVCIILFHNLVSRVALLGAH